MTVAFCLRSSLALMLSFSPSILIAAPIDSATWDAVDKILGRPGKLLPGEVHRFGWPRSDLHVSVGGTEVAPRPWAPGRACSRPARRARSWPWAISSCWPTK